ncbi:hypothetical protein [Microvirga massiliensis]|uniref:hypothetical protein n=1 Tax=Microvirga massiliensis TaxID=1033741 RepID=UPI000AABEE1D|nr:hypothetical protein [Microvirga massiliensis]
MRAEAVGDGVAERLYLLPASRIAAARISSHSRWDDSVWHFERRAPGQRRPTIYWNFELPDGSRLTDTPHEVLLDALKRFYWSLMYAPSQGGALSAVSVAGLHTGLRCFVRWMILNGLPALNMVSAEMLDRYRDDLPAIIAGDDDLTIDELEDDEPTFGRSAVWSRLAVPRLLWQQAEVLREAGCASIADEPWPGANLNTLALSIATKAGSQIPPLPDEVSIPILESAYYLVNEAANSIIALQDVVVANSGSSTTHLKRRRAALDQHLRTIDFSAHPWLARLCPSLCKNGRVQKVELRRLVLDLVSAAVIIVQATTGMRISEIAALRAGINRATGLPRCVHVRPSVSGAYEIFFVRSLLSKTVEAPEERQWLLGMRLQGDSVNFPPALTAVVLLDRLLRPWRDLIQSEDLIVGFTARSLPRSRSGVSVVNSERLLSHMRMFIERHVDLSRISDTSKRAVQPNDLKRYRDSRGQCFRSHQWRKTLAHFVFNTDSKLLPALQIQFHHISLAMTESSYLGHNQALFETFSSVRRQETASFIYEALFSGRSLAGRMGEQLTRYMDEVRELVHDLTPPRAWQRIFSFVETADLKLWFSPHGKCLPLNPGHMRCHDLAGTASWQNREPNYSARSPSVCVGCPSFVLDERHVAFWEQRYIDNWVAFKRAEIGQGLGGFRAVRARADQAKALLMQIGADIESLETRARQHLGGRNGA